MKKFIGGLAIATMAGLALTSCGGSSNDETGRVVETGGKVGIILSGTEGGETKSFKAHWEALAKDLDVSIVYEKFQGQDPAYYTTCAEKLVSAGVDAVICNFEMDGKENVLDVCIDEEIYVAYSGSTLSKDIFDEYADSPYFIGEIAPSANEEQSQAYEMTKFYIEKYYGANKEALPAGTTDTFAVWPVDYHGLTLAHQMTYRWKGIKQALSEYGVTVSGDEQSDSTKWKLTYTDNSVLKDKVALMGNNLTDMNSLIAQCSSILGKNPASIITTCNGDYLLNMFASYGVLSKESSFATIDSFVTEYEKWYKVSEAEDAKPAFKVVHNPYLVGKYSAINEAVLATTVKALRGNPIRDNGKAISVNQTYWHATNLEEFNTALDVSSKFSYSKADFDAITTVDQLQKLFDDATVTNLKNLLK